MLGVTPGLNGYEYIAYAVEAVKEDLKQRKPVRKITSMYEEIGKLYGTNWKAVERCIRTEVAKACVRKNEKYKELFWFADGIPTPSCFIYTIAEYLVEESEKVL